MRALVVGRWMRALLACRSGVSAVEFALFAPMLCLGLLAVVDIGMAVGTRMELDRNVRAGAQAAMTLDNPEPQIETIVRASANFAPTLEVGVLMTCACGSVGVDCATFCDAGEEPSVFYTIRATREHAGPLFKTRAIASETRVQVR